MKAYFRHALVLSIGLLVVSQAVPVDAATVATVVTLPATGQSNTVATLNGTLDTAGTAAATWFEWGWSPYTNTTRTTVIVTNPAGPVTITNVLTGLTPGLTYYARLVASNGLGLVRGKAVGFGSPSLTLNGPAVVTNGNFTAYLQAGADARFTPQTIAAGLHFGLVIKGDQTVLAWGDGSFTPSKFPDVISNTIAIAAGVNPMLALRSNGTVFSQGYLPLPPPSNVTNVTAIAAGGLFGLALKADGTVVGWGQNSGGAISIPAGLTNVIGIAAGFAHSLALKSDHTVVAWGDNNYGLTNVPPGLTNVIALASQESHNLALKSDGTVVAWGSNLNGQTNVPSDLTNVTALAAGMVHSLALKGDGTVVAWGEDFRGVTEVPPGLSNVTAIAASDNNSLALKSDGTVVIWGDPDPLKALTNVPSTLNSIPYVLSGNLNTNVAGTNILTYFATSLFGGVATPVTRTVVVLPAPALLGVSPNHGPTSGGITLTLTGTNFGATGSVTIGGQPAVILTNGWTPTNIQCRLPAGQGFNQTVVVTTYTRDSAPQYFNYDGPFINDVSPPHAPTAGGTYITLSGTNFGLSGTLTLAGNPVTSISDWSQTQIIFTVPPGVGTNLPVAVTVGGQPSPAAKFSYDPPVVANVIPGHGPTMGGMLLTLVGTDFGPPGSGSVTVGPPIPPASISQWTPTNIQCFLPPGQGTNQPVVVTVSGQMSAPQGFTYDPPSIKGLNPTSGSTAGGQYITISGTNFGLSGSVTVGGIAATNFTDWTHSQVVFLLPAGVGSNVPVVLTVGNQTSPAVGFNYNAPVIQTVNPTNGPTAGGTTLTLQGTDFGTTGFVTVGGSFAQPLSNGWSPTQIQCTLPMGQGTNQPVFVTVGGQQSAARRFDYDAPLINNVSPGHAPTAGGTNITLTGTNFGSGGSVTVGGIPALSYPSWGQGTIVFQLPPGVGSNLPVVVTAGNQPGPAAYFSYDAPGIKSLSPTNGPTAGGINVTITGTNFGTTGFIEVGGHPALLGTNGWTPTNIQCVLPRGQGKNQPVVVMVAGQPSIARSFDYDPPIVYAISPTNGPTAGGVLITLTGTNLGGSGALAMNGDPIQVYQSWTDSAVTFLLPPGEGAGVPVDLTTGGQASPPVYFSYSPPGIQNISPPTGPTAGGILLTITGTNFGLNPSVTVGLSPAFVKTNTPSLIQCTLPPGQGTNQPVVVTAGAQASAPRGFDYASPLILNVDPSGGPTAGGTAITISGLNFGLSGQVTVGGVPATFGSGSSWSDSQIQCTTPRGVGGAAQVYVITALQPSNPGIFNYALPSLAIANIAGSITLIWPAFATDYVLEKSGDLRTGAWTQFEPTRTINGTNFNAIVSPAVTNAFFRLRQL